MIDKKWLHNMLLEDVELNFAPEDIHTDSRNIKDSQVFLPLKGESFDGHNFIDMAVNKGVQKFFYEPAFKDKIEPQNIHKGICVHNTYETLKAIAKGYRADCIQAQIAAITGSVGKTTTKEMLICIANKASPTLSAKGSFNNEIGVPLTLLKWKKEQKFAVIEFGARHRGDISFLCDIVKPNVAACINVSLSHVGEFGSLDNILQTKTEIFRDTSDDTVLVTNADNNDLMSAAKKTNKPLLSFGFNNKADVQIKEFSTIKNNGMKIILDIFNKKQVLTLSCYHDSYPINVAAACAIAKALKIENDFMIEGLLDFVPVAGRFNIINHPSFNIIDDSYNASPDSIRSGLKSYVSLFPTQTKIVILGGMLELGDISKKEHRDIGEFCAAAINPNLLITVGDLAQYIQQGAIDAKFPTAQTLHFNSSEELVKNIDPTIFVKDSAIYVKGSNGIRLSAVIKFLQSIGQ